MSSIRCKLGIHNWRSWSVMLSARDHQERRCMRCGLVQVQQIVASRPRTKSFDEEQGWCTDVNCLITEPHAPHSKENNG